MLWKLKSEFLLRFSASAIPKRDKRVLQQRVSCVSVLDVKGWKLRQRDLFQGTVETNFMDTGHVVEFDASVVTKMRKTRKRTKLDFIVWKLKKAVMDTKVRYVLFLFLHVVVVDMPCGGVSLIEYTHRKRKNNEILLSQICLVDIYIYHLI